jgi:hypothetical protein
MGGVGLFSSDSERPAMLTAFIAVPPLDKHQLSLVRRKMQGNGLCFKGFNDEKNSHPAIAWQPRRTQPYLK